MIVQPPVSSSSNESGPASPSIGIHRRPPVVIQQVVVDQPFVQSVQNLDTLLQSGNVLEYCDQQIASTSNSQDEQILWRFLRASFEVDPRNHYIELLGFRRDDILQRIQTLPKDEKNHVPTEAMNGLHLGENQTKKKSTYGWNSESIFIFRFLIDNLRFRCGYFIESINYAGTIRSCSRFMFK